jgi:ribonuclease HI
MPKPPNSSLSKSYQIYSDFARFWCGIWAKVIIHTDGGCSPNPGPGGWAAILTFDDREKIVMGAEPATTSIKMELTAAIQALRLLDEAHQVELYTDSQYLQQGITEWLPRWIERNWRRADKKPAKNRELWEVLQQESLRHEVSWHKIEGHAGDELNERVHQLVQRVRDLL